MAMVESSGASEPDLKTPRQIIAIPSTKRNTVAQPEPLRFRESEFPLILLSLLVLRKCLVLMVHDSR